MSKTLADFEAALPPPRPEDIRRHVWTEDEDAFLRKYWPSRDYLHTDLSKALGICTDLCRRRYRELTQ